MLSGGRHGDGGRGRVAICSITALAIGLLAGCGGGGGEESDLRSAFEGCLTDAGLEVTSEGPELAGVEPVGVPATGRGGLQPGNLQAAVYVYDSRAEVAKAVREFARSLPPSFPRPGPPSEGTILPTFSLSPSADLQDAVRRCVITEQKQTLTVGVSVSATRRYGSFIADLAGAIGERYGWEVRIKEAVTPGFTEPEDIAPQQLDAGDFDMTDLRISSELGGIVYSEPFDLGDVTVVAPRASQIRSLSDLPGVKVGVSSVPVSYLQEGLGVNDVRAFPAAPDAIKALRSGAVEAAVIERVDVSDAVPPGQGLIATSDRYGFAFSADDFALRDLVNDALRELIEDGTYEKIYRARFKIEPPEEILEAP